MIDISKLLAVDETEWEQRFVPVIGWLYDQVPTELIYAGGMQPFHLAGRSYPTNESDEFFPNFFCPYATSVLEGCLSGRYDFLDGVVFTNACNALERVYDIWKHQRPLAKTYMLDVPRKHSKQSEHFFLQNLIDLKLFFENQFEIEITDSKLTESIKWTNKINALTSELQQCFRDAHNDLSYAQFLQVIEAGSYCSQADYFDKLQALKVLIPEAKRQKTKAPTVLLAGSMISDDRLMPLIEETGIKVVFEDLSMGHTRWSKRIREDIEPLKALAEAYLMQANTTRMADGCAKKAAKYADLYEQLEFDGVIYVSLRFCINHAYDHMEIKHLFEQLGVPVLFVESDYSGAGLEQIKTRIQAFAEML